MDTKKIVFNCFNNKPTKLQLLKRFLDWRTSKSYQCSTDEKRSCHHCLNGKEQISFLDIKCDLTVCSVTFESGRMTNILIFTWRLMYSQNALLFPIQLHKNGLEIQHAQFNTTKVVYTIFIPQDNISITFSMCGVIFYLPCKFLTQHELNDCPHY